MLWAVSWILEAYFFYGRMYCACTGEEGKSAISHNLIGNSFTIVSFSILLHKIYNLRWNFTILSCYLQFLKLKGHIGLYDNIALCPHAWDVGWKIWLFAGFLLFLIKTLFDWYSEARNIQCHHWKISNFEQCGLCLLICTGEGRFALCPPDWG